MFFSGDTGLTREYQRIRERFGPLTPAMPAIGARHAPWGEMHLGPDHAVQAAALLWADAWLPVHWGPWPMD